ncbi:multiplied multi-transmembrane transporter-like protein [Babesia gibsoni]|uniref:Multiplied multi-transmembrane transporter-like protein n=1 Tax=Babesia gibsoni TaxID=33632 RepID=A0AAD8US09_BABGI|nr:multiplied multi-transmembrane transporter-like protein [Babesia gibsoni]
MAGVEELPFKKYGTFAIVLYHVCAFVTACDIQMLVVFMRAFEVDLGLSPSSLSVIKTVEVLAGTACSPIWGLLVDRFVVNHVYPAGAFLGGVVCILLACVSNYPFIIFLRILHGFAMSSTGPVVHKIITESRSNSEMAIWYGFYVAVMCAASLTSVFCCSQLALKTIAGYYGWRLCYLVMSLVWLVIGVLVYFFLKPTADGVANSMPKPFRGVKTELREVIENVKRVVSIRTFWILVLATICGDAVASTAVYMMMYFQYCGLSDMMAGIACGVMSVGTFAGSILGGFIADFCQRKSEKYGRLLLGAIVIAIRLIFISLLLAIPIKDSSLQWYNWIELALFGVSALTFANVDRPTLVAVVPRVNQALGVALIRVIGDTPSCAIFLPLVGFLSEKSFGYVKTRELVEDMDPLIRDGNATALRKSMLYIACFGVVCGFFVYIAMIFTYPDDFEKKKRQDMILENP